MLFLFRLPLVLVGSRLKETASFSLICGHIPYPPVQRFAHISPQFEEGGEGGIGSTPWVQRIGLLMQAKSTSLDPS